MYTIDELLNMGKIERQTRASIKGEIDTLQRRAAEMQATMAKALEDEDAETYGKAEFTSKSIQAQLEKQRARLAQLEKSHGYTDDNVLAAWAEYAAEYNEQFAAAKAEYDAARYRLAEKFRDLVTMQGKALCVLDAMDRLLHPVDKSWFTRDPRLAQLDQLPNDNKYKAEPVTGTNPALIDAIYFCAYGDLPRGMYDTVAHIAAGAAIDPTKPRPAISETVRAFMGYTL